MLTYNMDVTPESVWKRTTPSEAELAQPYYCTEAGVFYAQQHFSTARTDKESYILFYTLRGAGLIEQGESHVVLSTGQALLLNCRTPQSYCTAPGQSCWHHYWVHLDGAGVAAMEPLLLPGKKLTPVQLTGVKMQEYFEMLLGQMEHSTVDSMVTTGLALHEMLALCARSILAEAETTSARQVILQAAETLRKNYQQELCLADLLAEAHMSKSYFLRLFRRYMGTTPYNYLVNFRITQAKELLVLTDHSVSEIASYLKNRTAYAGVLADINESTIHRGHLESLLRRKLWNDYASLSRYDRTVGMRMSDYLIQLAEIQQILACLRLMSAGRTQEFFFAMPMFLNGHTHLDLARMAHSKNYAELLDALGNTPYRAILERFPPEEGRIPFTSIENALYTRLMHTLLSIVNDTKGDLHKELLRLCGSQIDAPVSYTHLTLPTT